MSGWRDKRPAGALGDQLAQAHGGSGEVLSEAGGTQRELMLEGLLDELALADVLLGGNLAQQ